MGDGDISEVARIQGRDKARSLIEDQLNRPQAANSVSLHALDASEKPVRKLCGSSFLQFSQRPIDQSKTLLGNRYLCVGGGLFIVAPAGIGKSVFTAQASIELACALPTFGIKPPRPLKSLIVQAEDD